MQKTELHNTIHIDHGVRQGDIAADDGSQIRLLSNTEYVRRLLSISRHYFLGDKGGARER